MGFRDKSGIDLENEIDPIFPASTAYFDRLLRPAQLEPAGHDAQLLDRPGREHPDADQHDEVLRGARRRRERRARRTSCGPRRPQPARPRAHRRPSSTGLRRALIAVVERGTAAASRHSDLAVAGKTGTAQNPHGKDHGWFIGFAPAEKPELVVGGIMEFAEHGTTVAPYVVRTLRRYILGPGHRGHDQGEGPAGRDGRARRTPRRVRSSSIPTPRRSGRRRTACAAPESRP